MDERIPARLRREPLLEAIWEIRFSGEASPVVDLIPGILFQSFHGEYQTVTRLPIAAIPSFLVEKDPNLRYQPKIRLEAGNRAIQVGDRVASLSCRRPYSGWARFSEEIRKVAQVLRGSGLLDRLERFSLKYVSLIEVPRPAALGLLNLEITMGDHSLASRPVQLVTEIHERDLVHIVQIVSPAEARLPGATSRLKGVLISMDSIKPLGEGASWGTVDERLDDVHAACKKMFFHLLKPETIQALGPEYEA